VLRHGVRVAVAPVVTLLGVDLGVLLGGALLTESIFNIPGVGSLSLDAITHADFPVIQGTVLLAALFVVLANLVVDVVYAFLDPRVRYG
jgi:peptide/nickel transport system permease protein